MKTYYIKSETYGTGTPNIIDEETMIQAEQGKNYLNPDDYMFHCEADCMEDAEEQYWKEFSEMAFDRIAESCHP